MAKEYRIEYPFDPELMSSMLNSMLGVEIFVSSVAPVEPVEHRPIQITYTVTNNFPSGRRLNGYLRYDGEAPPWLPSPAGGVSINDLAPGQHVRGVLNGLAPAAGQDVEITLVYEEFVPGTEFVIGYSATGSTTIDVRAQYELWVGRPVKLLNPRSTGNCDKVVVECTATYGGQPMPLTNPPHPFAVPEATHTEELGVHCAGDTFDTNLRFLFEGVPGVAPDLYFNYLFANLGYDANDPKLKEALDLISHAGAAIAQYFVPVGGLWGFVDQLHQLINDALLASCDGLVAADQFQLTSQQVADVTAVTGSYSLESPVYEGSPSPAVCGEVSHYKVTWQITRRSHEPADQRLLDRLEIESGELRTAAIQARIATSGPVATAMQTAKRPARGSERRTTRRVTNR